MLRKLDVRTRLVTVIAVPLAMLLLVAMPELARRRHEVGDGGALYAVLVGGGLLAAAALALVTARSITGPLRDLTSAADELATNRLPALLDVLRDPGDADERYLAATAEPLEVRSEDELARLAQAFNSVQAVAVQVASQQAELLRRGISDLYVNLARRNQSLIERQIQLLDRLEATEQDPEVLENLFLIDHLATRMRRNAESLLVLAGADSSPRRARPIDVVDVVRSACSEVEDFERVSLGDLATATVGASAVTDVAHILAELLDNALQLSSPGTSVRIDGRRSGGGYQLTITDQGVGIPAAKMAQLNRLLERPPVTGLALGRSLGCLVAARLAARHGIGVRLRAGDGGGVAAVVTLPRSIITIDADAPPRHPDPAMLAALDAQVPVSPVTPVVPAVSVGPVASQVGPVEPEAPATCGPAPLPPADPWPASVAADERPQRLRDALPGAAAFDQGLQTLLDDTGPVGLVEPPVGPAAPAGGPGRRALPRRVPGAAPAADVGTQAPEVRVRRSPDEVRSLLSTYRAGQRAGRASGRRREEDER
jgi:signal transduction histidine kinase